jgi:glycosyltransferase involved in cell wall biosynthesis
VSDDRREEQDAPMVEPGMTASVIVPAYRAAATLRRCVDALLAQETDVRFEVIVVQSADHADDLVALPEDPRLRVIDRTPRVSSALARNEGVALARGGRLAFTDADAIADPSWLQRLLEATDGETCVAGAILNGTPDNAVGTAEYLMSFLDLHPARPVDDAWHGATCNLLIPRRAWDRYGPFDDDMLGGEDTLLTATAHRDGRLRFHPPALVTHLNRTDLRAVVRRQHTYGRWTARCARRGAYHRAHVVRRTVLGPLLGAMRLVWVYTRAGRRMDLTPWQTARTLPFVALAMLSWTIGLTVEGYQLDRRATSPAPPAEPDA